MAWLDRLLSGGYSRVQIGGVDLPGEVALNFEAGAVAVDDPGNDRTSVTVGGATTVWTQYGLTVTASNVAINVGSTAGYVIGTWRQAGVDTIEVAVEMLLGTSPNLGSGALAFSLPPGISVDTSKLPGAIYLASSVRLEDASNSPANCGGVLVLNDSVSLSVIPSASATKVSATAPWTWAVGDRLFFFTVLPVTGLT